MFSTPGFRRAASHLEAVMDTARSSVAVSPGDGSGDKARLVELDALFRDEGPALLRFLRRRTRYPEDAADLLQETFARFARMSFAEKLDNPQAYLQRIAGNLLVDRSRAAEHRLAHVPLDDFQLVDPGPSPLSELEAKELLARLQVALERLRPKTRQVFLLHRVEGQTYERIATQLGISVKGVEKHMSKAIAHLDRGLRRR
jgi:RNA polymerase sigma factor (sigma-70 family)